jgi:DNA polymerase-3 subunit epsilon
LILKQKNNLEQRIVAFDTETTGLNYRTDVILSIGAVEFMKTLLRKRLFRVVFDSRYF